MNAAKISILAFLLCIASPAWAKGGYIYEYAGDVKVKVAGGAVQAATDSMHLDDNTAIMTGNMSRAVLKFEDGQLVVLSANTTFQIKKYSFDSAQVEKSSIFFSLFKGGLRAVTGLIGQQNKQAFKMTTPTATIGIRGTDFMLKTDGKTMTGQVTKGAMTMLTGKSLGVFTAGQSSYVPSSTASPAMTKLPPAAFLTLQVVPIPLTLPAPMPPPGTKTPPPTPQQLTEIAKGINIPGVKPADLATAMIEVGNKATDVTTGIVNFSPSDAAAIVKAAIKADPENAAAITTVAVMAAPTKAADITKAAIEAAPADAVAITKAAIEAAPAEADAITEAAVEAAPALATEIINAVDAITAPLPTSTITIPPPTGGGTASPN